MRPEPAGAGARAAGALLSVRGLVKHYGSGGSIFGPGPAPIRALDGVDLDLHAGETLALVGESGSGKSTLAKLIVRLEEPSSGATFYQGRNIYEIEGAARRNLAREIQIVFQDPYTSLNPRMTITDIVAEAWDIHPDLLPAGGRVAGVRRLLEQVGLRSAYAERYPHALSGGQRQRVGIARALAVKPAMIVCDEPVSALDVSVQAQVINLLKQIQTEHGLAYLFISHDLSIVRAIADRVAVLYLGRVVEIGSDQDIYQRPMHPYTQSLLSAVPIPDPRGRSLRHRIALKGEIPSPRDIPSGCRFRTRCWKAREKCALEDPALVDRGGHGHPSACHFPELLPVVA